MSVRKLVISDTQDKCVSDVINRFQREEFSWVYLGKDVVRCTEISRQIGDKGIQKDIAEQLQKTAFSIRQEYIDYIGTLSLKKKSLTWWASCLSEKNPFVSGTFQNVCNLMLALSIIESEKESNIVFFIESRFLRLSLQDIFLKKGFDNFEHVEPIFSGMVSVLKDRYEYILKHGWFFFNNIYRIMFVKFKARTGKLNSSIKNVNVNDFGNEKLFLIHTWVDNRSFKEEFNFKDAYFGKLKDVMKIKGKNVVIVPYILHTVSYTESILKLIKSSENIIIPAMFLKIRDILKESISDVKKPSFEKFPDFNDIDISRLIHEDILLDWKDTRVNSNLLAFYFIKNLKNSGFDIEQFTYTYENHTWEKIYCCAFKEFFPLAKTLGYQHAAISQMYLNYFVSSLEFDYLPLPDVILTNGEHSGKLMINSGYNPFKIKFGGAIRYEYLTRLLSQESQKENQKSTTRKGKHKVLVTTSIDKNESSELVLKSINAYSDSDIYSVIIKCHPVMPFSKVASILGIDKLPANFEVSESPISELVNECDILLYTSSTTCIEGLAAGIPVLHIGSSFIIDRDVLDSFSDVRISVKTEEDIRLKTKELLDRYQNISSEEKNRIKDKIRTIFGNVDKNTFDQFVLVEDHVND